MLFTQMVSNIYDIIHSMVIPKEELSFKFLKHTLYLGLPGKIRRVF